MEIPEDDILIGLDQLAKRFRKDNHVKITTQSDQKISPILSFNCLQSKSYNFSEKILYNLTAVSYANPTPIQSYTVPIMTQRRDLIASAPTGTGKTAAYLIPLLNQLAAQHVSGTTVVPSSASNRHQLQLFAIILSPTQELVRQIWSEVVRLGRDLLPDSNECFAACLGKRHYANRCKTASAKSSSSKSATDRTASSKHHLRELRLPRSTKILIGTPNKIGRLLGLDANACPFEISNLAWLIIDECDKLLQVNISISAASTLSGVTCRKLPPSRSRSFRDQLEPVLKAVASVSSNVAGCNSPTEDSSRRPNLALFSATVSEDLIEWINKANASTDLDADVGSSSLASLIGPDSVQLRVGKSNSAVASVSQELRYCATEEGKLLEMRYLLVTGLAYPCLIFMESRERAKELVKEILLSDSDLLAAVISSEKTESQRAAIVRAFRDGSISVLVCTDLLGRGIDFKDVNMVVNYDLPASIDEYIHRIGRTGRAGASGRAISLWTDTDLPNMPGILGVMRRSHCQVDPDLDRLVKAWLDRRRQLCGADDDHSSRTKRLTTRRSERRFLHALKSTSSKTSCNKLSDQLKWVRPWNPHRKKISQLTGARVGGDEILGGGKRNPVKSK